MIIDVTGVILIPGNGGRDCPGNGSGRDEKGMPIECCCDECDYALCCYDPEHTNTCEECDDLYCPHSPNLKSIPQL